MHRLPLSMLMFGVLLDFLVGASAGVAVAQNVTTIQNRDGQPYVYAYLEAEDFDVRAPMVTGADPRASMEGFIYVPREPVLTFPFDIPVPGDYMLWARVINGGDGFRVFVDGENVIKWRQMEQSAAWTWTAVADPQTEVVPLAMSFKPGKHTIAFEYSHNMDQPFKIDLVVLTNNRDYVPDRLDYLSPPSEPGDVFLFMEAEDGILRAPFSVEKDANASRGRYAVMNCYLTVGRVYIPVDGQYKCWGRFLTPSGNADSVFVGVGLTGDVHSWNTIGLQNGQWNWDELRDRNQGNRNILLDLHKGWNEVRIKQREAGAKLDRLLITNDTTFVPGKRTECSTDAAGGQERPE